MAAAALTVPAARNQTGTVILLHGLGDSGAGWAGLAENWRRRNKLEEIKFIFPNAPAIPITVNFGLTLPGWYDIVSKRSSFEDLKTSHDEEGLLKSRTLVRDLIDKEITAGIPASRIVLGGFSQGGALSVFAGLTSPHRLAGIFGLSCYLVLGDKIKAMAEEAGNRNAAIDPAKSDEKSCKWFMGHGDKDAVVKYEWGVKTAEVLREQLGVKDLDFKTYHNLAHSADPLEIEHLEAFIGKCLPPLGEGKGK